LRVDNIIAIISGVVVILAWIMRIIVYHLRIGLLSVALSMAGRNCLRDWLKLVGAFSNPVWFTRRI